MTVTIRRYWSEYGSPSWGIYLGASAELLEGPFSSRAEAEKCAARARWRVV